MKVIIGKAVYEMNRKQLRGALEAASSLIPFGIYAVQKAMCVNSARMNLKMPRN